MVSQLYDIHAGFLARDFALKVPDNSAQGNALVVLHKLSES
jgi:hypothetical protein